MPPQPVPESWWRNTCEVIHHPIACVSSNDQFIWANGAFERLIGYSLAELQDMRWQDVTVSSHVGATERNQRNLRDRTDTCFSQLTEYRHKNGKVVPVEVTTWRHPMGNNDEVTTYISEAIPEKVTQDELDKIRRECEACMAVVKSRFERVERVMAEAKREGTSVNVGNNSADVIKWMVVALAILIGAVSYLTYIAGWPHHGGNAQPPVQHKAPAH